ncbi:MAG: DNA mismatch repair endonuclease MutL [Ruminococcaceae bacterium]|nr:DNA mismatch repair endonuclease MutL [Oscillospiraceae bacterium]
MAINILDKHTANLIAAGEVVERPASAIKEMLENSADAGATRVTVEIKNGGTTYFRVTDNGCGMSKEDLPKAILRHATSKICTSEDLLAIGTYGFRGEALAAIAAVCDLRILTKRKEDDFGSVLHINSGEVLEHGEAGCPDGTTIAASDIFKNVPARRKFLKKDVSEGIACMAVTEKFALSRPDIAVTFIADGKPKLKTAGDGHLKNAIYSCLGKEFASKLLPLDYSYEGIGVSGYIGKPETARPGRSMQNFFINGRYVRSGTICAALEEGFRAFCPAGKFPAAVIFCTLDFSRVDVNIHPAKTEVKFSEEKKVFEAVLFAVRTALNKGTSYSAPEKRDENNIVFPDTNPLAKAPLQAPQAHQKASAVSYIPDIPKTAEKPKMNGSEIIRQIGVDASSVPKQSTETYRKIDLEEKKKEPIPPLTTESPRVPDFKNAFSSEFEGIADMVTKPVNEPLFVRASIPQASMEIFSPAPKVDIQQVKKDEPEIAQISFDLETEQSQSQSIEKPVKFKVIGECFDSFILVEKDDVLYIIDKHAAHERILYEEIKGIAKDASSQTLLEPVRIPLSTEEFAAVSENIDYFNKTGFMIDLFGTNSIIVRAYPSHIAQSDLSDVFTSIAAKLLEGNGHAAGDLFDRALFSAACKAAVKAGQRNTIFRDEEIAQKVFSSDAILYCPHGRPVITEFTKDKLYKMFKRT